MRRYPMQRKEETKYVFYDSGIREAVVKDTENNEKITRVQLKDSGTDVWIPDMDIFDTKDHAMEEYERRIAVYADTITDQKSLNQFAMAHNLFDKDACDSLAREAYIRKKAELKCPKRLYDILTNLEQAAGLGKWAWPVITGRVLEKTDTITFVTNICHKYYGNISIKIKLSDDGFQLHYKDIDTSLVTNPDREILNTAIRKAAEEVFPGAKDPMDCPMTVILSQWHKESLTSYVAYLLRECLRSAYSKDLDENLPKIKDLLRIYEWLSAYEGYED